MCGPCESGPGAWFCTTRAAQWPVRSWELGQSCALSAAMRCRPPPLVVGRAFSRVAGVVGAGNCVLACGAAHWSFRVLA
eukprot:2159674-Prymnesium_polylepis.2